MGFSRQEYWSGLPLPSLEVDSRGLPKPVPEAAVGGNTHIGQPEWDSWCLQFQEDGFVHAEDQQHLSGPDATLLGCLESQLQL